MKTIDITGMGGGYENEAQRMLWNGIRYLEKNNLIGVDISGIAYKQYENIFGICQADSPAAEKLDKAIMEGITDATGAMHQITVGHLKYISRNGLDKWYAEFEKMPDRIYDWDGSAESCPKTEISEQMEKK